MAKGRRFGRSDLQRPTPVPQARRIQSTVPGRITINLSGTTAKMIERLARQQRRSKNQIVESLIGQTTENNTARAPAVVRNKQQILYYSHILIEALQEALNYDPLRDHNQASPELRIEDRTYLEELRSLVTELQRLNDLLAHRNVSQQNSQVINLGKHFDKFLESYASALGKAAAGLTAAAVAGLLYQAGVGDDLINHIWHHVKIPI